MKILTDKASTYQVGVIITFYHIPVLWNLLEVVHTNIKLISSYSDLYTDI